MERVHAVENEALSKHGRFDSHQIHHTGKRGSLVHRQNITAMAEIQTCLNSGVLYHGKPLRHSEQPVTLTLFLMMRKN